MTDKTDQPSDEQADTGGTGKQINIVNVGKDLLGLDDSAVNTHEPKDKKPPSSGLGKIINKAGKKLEKIGSGIGKLAKKGTDAVQDLWDEHTGIEGN